MHSSFSPFVFSSFLFLLWFIDYHLHFLFSPLCIFLADYLSDYSSLFAISCLCSRSRSRSVFSLFIRLKTAVWLVEFTFLSLEVISFVRTVQVHTLNRRSCPWSGKIHCYIITILRAFHIEDMPRRSSGSQTLVSFLT